MHIMQNIRRIWYGVGVSLLLVPMVVSAQWVDPSSNTNLTGLGLSNQPISLIILVFLRWLLYIMGFLAIIAFVISAIFYLTAAGDDDKIEKAKTTMIYAIIGIIVGLMGLIIVTAVDSWLFASSASF